MSQQGPGTPKLDNEKAASGGSSAYGTPEHAAAEALVLSVLAHEGFVSATVEDVAAAVISGLRERGFAVTSEPRCECGWTGRSNHYHDMRLGKATTPPAADVSSQSSSSP